MIEEFWSELYEGEIHTRDQWQFELKSEFMINPILDKNVYKQEFFLFIPSPLQINTDTLSKSQFYSAQTNLIRYKTPRMTLRELVDPSYSPSPLNRLQHLLSEPTLNLTVVLDELQLFGNIFKASLRDRISHISESVEKMQGYGTDLYTPVIKELCEQINEVCQFFRQMQTKLTLDFSPQATRYFRYTDEYISYAIDEYFLILLEQFRHLEERRYEEVEKLLGALIVQEKLYRKTHALEPQTKKGRPSSNESILYRQGLLNRFMLEALMLKSYRFSLEEKHGNILGSVAAGVAMFVYMVLFVWKVSVFVINSLPFIMFAVIFYILKDRLKEGLKKIYYKQAYRWFPDYSTEIWSADGDEIGRLNENFAFISPEQLPPGFLTLRNTHFHEELQALNRHETIIQYKREVTLYHQAGRLKSRRRELTTIFRLNIQSFLQKASNALQPNLMLDPYTLEISERLLPKIYHLNIIIRNTYLQPDLSIKSEVKTFRVVVDKTGIKRVELIKSS